MLDPLDAHRALEFNADFDAAKRCCAVLRDFDLGEIEVVFQARIDLDNAHRCGDEIWVMDPDAITEQLARATVGYDEWTDWMNPPDLWADLLRRNGVKETAVLVISLGAAADAIRRAV